jgi:16S rRNA (cytidine1402-2'-O)-methyltransferase
VEDRLVSEKSGGHLYMVSTPIGHLGDFSFRGVEVLKAASVIACEDTRHTRRLLTHYGVGAPLVSLHAHSSDAVISSLLDRVERGDDVAYVTDAGTPVISDPGGLLAERAHARGLTVVPIPGPSAVMAALAAAGFPGDRFIFLGFLPKRGTSRKTALDRVAQSDMTVVCYEAPGRTVALLEVLAERCGTERPAAIARELTKLHEDIRRGTLGSLATYYEAHPPRGEVTVVIGAASEAGGEGQVEVSEASLEAVMAELQGTGSPAAIAKEMAKRLGISRQEAYKLLTTGPGDGGAVGE